jgi:superoxide oxidase
METPFDSILDSLAERARAKRSARSSAMPEQVQRQSAATIAFHWGAVIAIVISVIAIYLREAFEDKAVRAVLLDLHRQLGILVLLSVPLRQVVRCVAGHSDFSANVPAILRWAARFSHGVLYAFLLAIPLVGWAVTSAHAVDLRLFGLVSLPGLVAPDSDLADELADYHAWLAYGLMGLVFVHALAALWHHYLLRDSVLVAMLPGAKRPRGREVGPGRQAR